MALYHSAIAAAGSAYQQGAGGNGIVSIEAEHNDGNVTQGGHSWTAVAPSGYSGSGAMEASPNNGTRINTGYVSKSPRLDFQVNFVHTGTHYVWVRGRAASGRDDSVHVGLDGQAVSSSDRITGIRTSTWKWSRNTMDGPVATIEVTAPGMHTVNLWMREDGAIIDKLLLTTNSAYTPSGVGPASTRNAAAPVNREFNLDSLKYNVGEGAQVTAVIIRTDGAGSASVLVGTNGVTAFHGEDYWGFDDQQVSFADGETQKTVTVQTIDDGQPENDEIFELLLSGPSADYTLGSNAVATVTISDNNAPPANREFNLDSLNYSVGEGAQVTAVITRTDGAGSASVLVGTNGVTAFHGEDYWGFDGQQVSFADGETQKTVTVQTIDDTQSENNESFDLLLSGPSSGYVLGSTAKATVTINDNDGTATAGTVTLSWTPPTTHVDGTALTDLAGHKIYYGTSPGSYSNTIDVNSSGISSYVVENLSPDTYYFAVKAYDGAGNESAFSNQASKVVN